MMLSHHTNSKNIYLKKVIGSSILKLTFCFSNLWTFSNMTFSFLALTLHLNNIFTHFHVDLSSDQKKLRVSKRFCLIQITIKFRRLTPSSYSCNPVQSRSPKDTCNWCSSTNSEFQEKIKSSLAGVDGRDFWYDDGPWDNFVLHRRKRNRIKSRGVKFPWGGHSRCYWTFVWHTTRMAQGDCLQSNGCPCLSKMGVSLDLKAEQTVYRFQNLLFVFVLSVQLKNRLKCWLILRLSSCQKSGILGMAGYMCLVLTSVCDTY